MSLLRSSVKPHSPSLKAFVFFGFFLCLAPGAWAQQALGSATGLPVPRYVSLKSDHVNLREGPSKDHATKWIYQRAGLPVEITAEFATWRRIRDSEGAEGWVLHSLLSGKRTALIAPWKKDGPPLILRTKPENEAAATAKLAPGVIAQVKNCDAGWCRIKGEGFDGYIAQSDLWGVYPNEKVE
jgi:SH3-like domain-containing protein